MVRASALSTQNTDRTHSGGCLIFDRSANGMHSARIECLTGGTAVDVMQWIVSKSFIAKDRSLAPVLRFTQRVSQVRRNPALLTGDEVFGRAILVIGYHRLRLGACVALMLIDQGHELFIFRDTARRCLGRGYYSLLLINYAMVLLARTRSASPLPHQRRGRSAFHLHPIIAR